MKRVLIKGVVSFVRYNLLVLKFYYLSVSKIWPYKRGGLCWEGTYKTRTALSLYKVTLIAVHEFEKNKSCFLAHLTQRIMWSYCHYLMSFVVCKLLHFNLYLWNHWVYFEPNLEGMFIRCYSKKFMLIFIWGSEIHKRRGVNWVFSNFIYGVFIFQPVLIMFFLLMFLMKLSLFSITTGFIRFLSFPRYKRAKRNQHPEWLLFKILFRICMQFFELNSFEIPTDLL